MIYEIVLKVEKKVAGKFAKWLPEHIKQVLESPGFKLARVARPQSETESDHLKWVVQYDIASKEYFESYLNERAPQMRAQAEQEFGNALIATRCVYDPVQVIEKSIPKSDLLMSDFPKVYCPFIRQTFKVDSNQWKKLGQKLQLRNPEVYLAVNRINPGFEWVFEDKDTFAVEKLHGTNVKILLENGKVLAIQNRKNIIDPLLIAKGQNFILEGILNSAAKGVVPMDGEYAGEVIGPKLQGNPYKLETHEWYPFDLSITNLRYRSFDEHDRNYQNWSAWFKDHLYSRLFTKRASKKGSDEKVFAEGVIFYNLKRKSESKTWMAKLRRDMFPWYYEGIDIQNFDPAGRDKIENQEQFD
ncbi:MAG: hypothetical protein A2Z91_02920 [Deltaproteobacteria bacterium GWA2_38_16]|nr:MAG: hypothetical protein A2Z91_02920 [Deltaproteobacteria bacterium GWA2_38_16]OGQ02839.1 MAG: hypothetical protein A3D19_06345 [Deltaproteobacteria bacterium RIFCSPHIGHO2_02_FULL_38_15]HBQ21683.1 hypothetical protein [Deltaproteobacteria bacterium]